MSNLFNTDPLMRTQEQWRALLIDLVTSFSSFIGYRFIPVSWFVEDDQPSHASTCNCVDDIGSIDDLIDLQACGTICISINYGEAVWVICDLLLFSKNQRIKGKKGMEVLTFRYGPEGWVYHGWVNDEYGEWEAHIDNSRWHDV